MDGQGCLSTAGYFDQVTVEEPLKQENKGIYLEQKGRNEVEGRSFGKCALRSN
jgi:hypothetical protein